MPVCWCLPINMHENSHLFFFLLLVGASRTSGLNFLESLINDKLESFRPSLTELNVDYLQFESLDQEFGDLKGNLTNLTILGFDGFEALVIKAPIFPLKIQNVTLRFPQVDITALYEIDGMLIWPLGSDIHIFGKGLLRANLENLIVYIDASLTRGENDTGIVVKELGLDLSIDNCTANLEGLMGGGSLSDLFNGIINDVALTVFDYYKLNIVARVKPFLTSFINDVIGDFIPQ